MHVIEAVAVAEGVVLDETDAGDEALGDREVELVLSDDTKFWYGELDNGDE